MRDCVNYGRLLCYCDIASRSFAIFLLTSQMVVSGSVMSHPREHTAGDFNETNYFHKDNSTHSELVKISITALFQNDSVLVLPINTLQDVAEKQQLIGKLKDDIELVIERKTKQPIVLYLKRNRLIIPKGFTSKHFTKHGKPVMRRHDQRYQSLALCFYTGQMLSENNSLASINICEHVTGALEISEHKYLLQSSVQGSNIEHRLVEEVVSANRNGHCGNRDDDADADVYTHKSFHRRYRHRVARDVHLPAGHNSQTNYVELYVVMDNRLYRRTGSVDATIMRAINMVNYASALYRQLNIFLALVAVEVWNDRDKIPYKLADGSLSEYNADALLAEFNKYRMYKINRNTPNDDGQLFTAVDFEGGTIGKGSTGTICTHSSSGGVTYDDIADNYIRAATTMAHELGHNLKMSHSDDTEVYAGQNCECEYPDNPNFKSCVMHSSSDRNNPATKWSPCTRRKLEDHLRANLGQCLRNKPTELYKVGRTPICGNLFVEEGEECDCGQPADCTSKCCDATTCKLHVNATCATGSCCDLNTCSIRPRSTLCRPIQDGECDLKEFCDGETEWCPSDTYKRDGTPCMNRADAFCYAGKCKSHDSQCHFVWGLPSSRSSDNFCYQQFNGKVRYYGNCGWSPALDGETTPYLQRQFHACVKEEDKFCGLLQCQDDSTDNIGSRTPAITNFALLRFGQKVDNHICNVAAFDVGYKEFDPGMVPNGAKCGENKMCINSVCTQIAAAPDSCDCNGHGVCNQQGQCHCDLGWSPSNCRTAGYGGSESSNPASVSTRNLDVVAGLVAFFCGIVPMGIVIAVVGYRRRRTLKKLHERITNRLAHKNSPDVIHQAKPRLEIEVPAVLHQNGAVAAPGYGEFKGANSPPGGRKSGHPGAREKAGGRNHITSNGISPPVLQSTTNHPQVSVVGLVHQGPTRAAPPPPRNSTRAKPPTYENVKPAVAAKPGSRPPTAPKPAVLPKPKMHK